MIENFLILIKKKFSSAPCVKRVGVKIAALFFLLFFSSCTDQGCIEADDFGEYEYQTLVVTSNGFAASCEYDYSLDITSPGQGSGIQSDLTSGSKTIYDRNGDPYTNSNNAGCNGFENVEYRTLCINDAIRSCQTRNAGTSSSAEPLWEKTAERDSTQNYGVTIHPYSEISIKAVGTIKLGSQTTYPTLYASPRSQIAAGLGSDLSTPVFFDVEAGQTVNVKFSGEWNEGTKTIGGGTHVIDASSTGDEIVYNGARRLVVYGIPAPYGYKFDASQSTEEEGTIGVPLLPDTQAWGCTYDASDPTKATCANDDYSTLPGYTNLSSTLDSTIKQIFPLTAASQSLILGHYGGMIRWDDDGFEEFNSSFTPPTGSTTIAQGGMMLGDASGTSGVTIPNTQPIAYQVSFRSTEGACNNPISVSIEDQSNTTLQTYEPARPYVANNITLSASWSTYDLALEPGHNLVIDQITDSFGSLSSNCGDAIEIRFIPYKEIEITQSGLVSFTILDGDGSSFCRISGSIINPQGSHFEHATDSNYTADFYEYDPLNASSPLYDLQVNTSATSQNWTSPIFVRKGQKIRFNPKSWDGQWSTITPFNVNCGVGMAMRIVPRPALLCRGTRDTTVDNPQCLQDYSSGVLNGCTAFHEACFDDTSDHYCPVECQDTISCSAPADPSLPSNQKLGCSRNAFDPATCTMQTYPNIPNTTYCDNCSAKLLTSAGLQAQITESIDQCYDLEDYKGKVSNIKSNNDQSDGFEITQLTDNSFTKGAKILGDFNGTYGNLSSFSYSGTDESSAPHNRIYQGNVPLLFSAASRVRLLLLDDNDFINMNIAYNDNSAITSGYSGANGMKVHLSGPLEFHNGAMLAARLCSEDGGGVCQTTDPTGLDPAIIEYGTTEPISEVPLGVSNYDFLDSGTLKRNGGSLLASDCTDASLGATSSTTSLFYCHTQDSTSIPTNKLRLTFKIVDPETTDCDISTGGRGIMMDNPAYNASVDANDDDIPDYEGLKCDTNTELPIAVLTQEQINQGYSVCEKELYCANKYTNNSGSYHVTVKVKKPDNSSISNIIGGVIEPVVEVMDGSKDGTVIGQSERIYRLLIADPRYQTILSVCLVVMITFYGMATLMGVSELNHSELLNRLIKIGLIYLFVSPTGWFWFNELVVSFFKGGTDYLAFMMASSFDSSQDISYAIQTNDFYDKSILFGSVNDVFDMFFSDAVQKKISALLFADIFGFIYLWIIYLSFMLYVYAVCNAVLLYLTAQVFISILFILAPLFFIFTLFGQTKEMFDNWLKQLISFSLQQIFLLTTLAFFNMMMYEVIKMSLGYKICWDVVWSIKILGTIDLMSFWTIPGIESNSPSLFSILFIWVVASLMNKFISFMTDLAASISGGVKASSLGSGVSAAVGKVNAYASKRASDVYKGTVGHQIKRLDQKLFDSGKLASDARRKQKEQDSKDMQNKGAIRGAGDKAVNDYKVENATALRKELDAHMSQDKFKNMTDKEKDEERTKKEAEILSGVKSQAMKDKGAELGLSEKKVQELADSKGSTYRGYSAAGFATHSMRQLASGGGTLARSINDEGVTTGYTKKQAKSAMKEKRMTNKEDRDAFMKDVKDGKIKVEKSMRDKAKGAVDSMSKSAADTAKSVKNSYDRGTMTSDAADNLKAAPGAALRAAGSMVMSAGRKAAHSRASKMAQNAMGRGEYGETVKEMVADGEIDKMAPGTEFARSPEEKQKIEKRLTEKRNARKAKKASHKENASRTVDSVENAADNVNEEQSASGKASNTVGKLERKKEKYQEKTAASKAKIAENEARMQQLDEEKFGINHDREDELNEAIEDKEQETADRVAALEEQKEFANPKESKELDKQIKQIQKESKKEISALKKERDGTASHSRTKEINKEQDKLRQENDSLEKGIETRDDKIADIEETQESIQTASATNEQNAAQYDENQKEIEALEQNKTQVVGGGMKGMAKDALSAVTFGKYKGRKEAKKNWNNSEKGQRLAELKAEQKELGTHKAKFDKRTKGSKDAVRSKSDVDAIKADYDKYNEKYGDGVETTPRDSGYDSPDDQSDDSGSDSSGGNDSTSSQGNTGSGSTQDSSSGSSNPFASSNPYEELDEQKGVDYENNPQLSVEQETPNPLQPQATSSQDVRPPESTSQTETKPASKRKLPKLPNPFKKHDKLDETDD